MISFSPILSRIFCLAFLVGFSAACTNNMPPYVFSQMDVSESLLTGESEAPRDEPSEDYGEEDYGEVASLEDDGDFDMSADELASDDPALYGAEEVELYEDSELYADPEENRIAQLTRQLNVDIGDRIFFNLAGSRIDADGRDTIAQQASFLNDNPDIRITIEGHCDERGTREFNLGLGLRRANAMRSALIAAGVEPARMRAVSYGKERPVAPCSRERCWKVNRRAVIVINHAG